MIECVDLRTLLRSVPDADIVHAFETYLAAGREGPQLAILTEEIERRGLDD